MVGKNITFMFWVSILSGFNYNFLNDCSFKFPKKKINLWINSMLGEKHVKKPKIGKYEIGKSRSNMFDDIREFEVKRSTFFQKPI
jgi:hypothetical protein